MEVEFDTDESREISSFNSYSPEHRQMEEMNELCDDLGQRAEQLKKEITQNPIPQDLIPFLNTVASAHLPSDQELREITETALQKNESLKTEIFHNPQHELIGLFLRKEEHINDNIRHIGQNISKEQDLLKKLLELSSLVHSSKPSTEVELKIKNLIKFFHEHKISLPEDFNEKNKEAFRHVLQEQIDLKKLDIQQHFSGLQRHFTTLQAIYQTVQKTIQRNSNDTFVRNQIAGR